MSSLGDDLPKEMTRVRDRDFDLSAGREIERKDAEIERLLAALQAIADDPDTNVEAVVYARDVIAQTDNKSNR